MRFSKTKIIFKYEHKKNIHHKYILIQITCIIKFQKYLKYYKYIIYLFKSNFDNNGVVDKHLLEL